MTGFLLCSKINIIQVGNSCPNLSLSRLVIKIIYSSIPREIQCSIIVVVVVIYFWKLLYTVSVIGEIVISVMCDFIGDGV